VHVVRAGTVVRPQPPSGALRGEEVVESDAHRVRVLVRRQRRRPYAARGRRLAPLDQSGRRAIAVVVAAATAAAAEQAFSDSYPKLCSHIHVRGEA
jgi:hypothetical protein